MSKIKLGDITKIRTGKLDANASSENGKYPFFTCSKEPLRIDSYSFDCECVLVAGNGDLNVKYYKGKFDAYQRTYIIEDNSKGRLFIPYLYYFLELYVEELRKQSIGGVIKYIKLGNLTDAIIDLPSIETQKETIKILDNLDKQINNKKKQLTEYDQLIKSRFVEMFGDLKENPMNWEEVLITEVLGGKTSNGFFAKRDDYCENGNVSILGVADIVNRMYSETNDLPRTNATINDIEKFSVKYGDMLFCRSSLVASGIGKASIVPPNIKDTLFECHVIRLQLDSKKCIPEFMQLQSETSYFRNQVLKHAKTSTMTTIGQDGILSTKIILPPMECQFKLLNIIKQVDKLKFAVQQSLNETQQLFDSLMQEYFG